MVPDVASARTAGLDERIAVAQQTAVRTVGTVMLALSLAGFRERLDLEVVEEHLGIGFRPEPDAPRRRGTQRLLETLLPIDLRGDLLAVYLDAERVPGFGRCRDVADVIDDGSVPLDDFEVEKVVLERVRANAEVRPVRRDRKRDAGTLIDFARKGVEPNRDAEVTGRRIA